MSFAPYAVLWVILIIAAGICYLAERRNPILLATSLIATLLAFALWFFFQPNSVVSASSLFGRQWAVGQTAWSLTGIVLLLLLAAVVYAVLRDDSPMGMGTRPAWLLGLAAAVLPIVWAADDRSRVLAIAFFALVWFAVRRSVGQADTGGTWHAFWPFISLLPLWLAAGWPAAQLLLSTASAAMLLGVWPFGGWRRGVSGDVTLNLMTDSLPVIAGAAVLAAGLSSGLPTDLEMIAITVFAFLSFIIGLTQAWHFSFDRLVQALGPALSGIVLIVAVWATDDAMLSAVRLAVFTPAILTIIATLFVAQPSVATPGAARYSRLSPGLIGSIVIYAAVAGLPLTAGFVALSSLHEAWQAVSNWALVTALVVLLSLWFAAIFLTIRAIMKEFVSGREAWLRGMSLLLPILGLLQFSLASFGVSIITWIVIILPPILGVLLGLFVPGLRTLDGRPGERLSNARSSEALSDRLRHLGRVTADAIADAAAILEGEFGLLWLLGLVLLLLWLA